MSVRSTGGTATRTFLTPRGHSKTRQAFGILLATQAIRATSNIVARRNAPIGSATTDDGETTALLLGDAVLLATRKPRSVEFAAKLRAATPNSKLLINSNSIGANEIPADSDRAATLAATVRLVRQLTD